ncbi:MliC family protein [Deinococcus sp. HMF7604]|nr:MliC family protein [Deinococcus betulae]MBZ9752826.1 MliC family protein [Deinococcus betulae]
MTYRTVHYTCSGGTKLDVIYIRFATRPLFAVVNWQGKQYGLAEALSASGSRYAGLYGPAQAPNGLEWWEHQGQAELNAFTSSGKTKSLLTACKAPRG